MIVLVVTGRVWGSRCRVIDWKEGSNLGEETKERCVEGKGRRKD